MKDDPVLSRIREARRKISEKNNHDPRKMVNYYVELQKKYEEKLVRDVELNLPRS